ncbi:MAG: diguanylate cyclase, partial [Cyanobacteria bacterium P01_A01_bin.83]
IYSPSLLMSLGLTALVISNQYVPHGHCYLWQTPLVGLHVAADALIAIAYYSIAIFLIYFASQIEGLPFKGIFVLFSAFILSCGTTHLAEIWTLWHADYWISGILKGITALISLYTAASLIPLIPQALNLPSPEQIAALNKQLSEQIIISENAKQELHQLNQQLEQKIQSKTSDLIKANQDLQASTKFREKINDLTPNILYIYDLNLSCTIYCNPYTNELLGYSPLDILKLQDNLLDKLIHPQDLFRVKQHFANCLTLKDDKYLEIEYRIRDAQGEWHWLHDKNAVFCRNVANEPEQILGIAQDITHTRQIQLETEELNQKLEEQVLALARNNQARGKLLEMNEFIQACISLDEAQEVIGDLLQPLFPNTNGAIYLMDDNKALLNRIASWGITQSAPHFTPKECWGIRRGNSHQVQPNAPNLYCVHLDSSANLNSTFCLPMIAKGETIGMLYLGYSNTDSIERSIKDLAKTVAQNLAVSFANLKLQQKLRYQSLHDPLTNLYNRRYLLKFLGQELERANRKQHHVSVILIDIDHFKRFNDVYGHSAGDLVLSQVGAYLRSQIRPYDVACRYGGEELLIVMPNASLADTMVRAEKFRQEINQLQLEHDGVKLGSISVSIGISCFPDHSNQVEGLISAADKALYQAKVSRNCVKPYQ